jgi:signal transduction histidine kinase/CHASE1-domain containing sensor protein
MRDRRRIRGTGAAVLASLVVLLIGLSGTGLAARWVADAGRRSRSVAADRYASEARTAVQSEMNRYLDTVAAVAASLSAQEDLRASDFETVTRPLLGARLVGAAGLGLVVPATASQVASVQQFWRAQGQTDLTLLPATGATQHYFVVLQRTLDNQNSSLGFDLVRAPELRRILRRPEARNRVIASDSYILLKDRLLPPAARQHSFALIAPVTSPRRDGAAGPLRGWVMLGVRGGDLLKGTLQDTTQGQADVSLSTGVADDGTAPRATAVVARQDNGPAGNARLIRRVSVPVADRTWTLTTQSTDASARRDGGGARAEMLLGGGIGMSALLTVITWLVMTSRTRAVLAVERATADLRLAQRETTRQAALLQTIMDSLSDGVGAVDNSGAFMLHNPAARELLGVHEDVDDPAEWSQYYGLYRPDGVTPYPVDELPLVQALSGQARSQVDMVVRRAGDPVGTPISVSARPLVSAAGQLGAVAVFHDLTTHKEFQRQLGERAVLLEQANLELREVNKELEAFSYTVSHDLRAPLRAINAFSTFLLRDHTGHLEAQAVHYLTRVRENAVSMNALIEDLLAFSRTMRQPLHKRPTELSALVQEAWAEVREAGLTAGPEQADDELRADLLPVVPGDGTLLKQVFLNLLGNALKFRAPGQPVLVVVSSQVDPETGEPVITVRDNGIGFDPGHAEKIFGVFQRLHTSAQYEGTGIGLSIVHRIVTRHGGRVWAHGVTGEGAAFSFTLGPDTVPALTASALR